MEYVVLFIAGVLSASAAIGIWYFPQFRRIKHWNNRLRSIDHALQVREKKIQEDKEEFEKRKVSYNDLTKENVSLKQDLFNLAVQRKKSERDYVDIEQRQKEIDNKVNEVAGRYLKETVSWTAAKLNPNNYSICKSKLRKAVEECRSIGFNVTIDQEESLIQDLKELYGKIVREEFQRQEQIRIRDQIREEERLSREIEKKIQEAEHEQEVIAVALKKALEKTKEEHSAEIEYLRTRLKEAEENTQRAKSQAQMTRAGFVYVISNIGSFGEGVLKVGMSRRLEPMERIRELSGASVPFPFDVHMMISSNDAPTLENVLHRELHKNRVNKVNFRKEFFHADVETIREIVEKHHGKVDYVADPEALQYRESMTISDEDFEFMEKTAMSVAEESCESIAED